MSQSNRCYWRYSVVYSRSQCQFEVTEEITYMNSLHGKTPGETILWEVEQRAIHDNLPQYVSAGGGKIMKGTEKDLVEQILKLVRKVSLEDLFEFWRQYRVFQT